MIISITEEQKIKYNDLKKKYKNLRKACSHNEPTIWFI